jgi:hypothetical protein
MESRQQSWLIRRHYTRHSHEEREREREREKKHSGKAVVIGRRYLQNTDHEPYLYTKAIGQSTTIEPTFLSVLRFYQTEAIT